MRRLLFAAAFAIAALCAWLALEPWLRPSVVVLLFHHTPDFEPVAAWLERHGHHSLTSAELRAFLRGQFRPPRGSVVLTFDDGDATNHLSAAPALKRHGFTGIFFTLTDRMGDGPPRVSGSPPADSIADAPPDADMYAARHPGRPDPWSMRWSEARLLEAGGAGEVGSHTASHHFAFRSDSLLGFMLSPGWRETDALGGSATRGAPRFEGGPALLAPEFQPDKGMVEALARAAAGARVGAGAASGMRGRDRAAVPASLVAPLPVDSLRAIVRTFRQAGRAGVYETPAAYETRLTRELDGSRRRLSDSLGRDVRLLAWPWGRWSPELRERARRAGYTLIFTVQPRACVRGDDSLAVPRVSARPDTAWLHDALRIFSRPTLGRFYGRLHPPVYPS
ncbi:MAG: polysaccharide deacetylase family protein [Candidatus Eisenbacteria bacterium]|nr:polysaccharide deacetylase family protein [Candidatus Eisenbacteria bacterium]